MRRQIPDYPRYWIDPKGRVYKSHTVGGVHSLDPVPVNEGRVLLRSGTKVRSVPVGHLLSQIFAIGQSGDSCGEAAEEHRSSESEPAEDPAEGVSGVARPVEEPTIEEATTAPGSRKRRRRRRGSRSGASGGEDGAENEDK